MEPLQLIRSKRAHQARLAGQRGAAGEQKALKDVGNWIKRPSGAMLRVLLSELRAAGTEIKGTSFDAIHLPPTAKVDFLDAEAVRTALPQMTFIEIKTANQRRVKAGFSGFFFAITENEIQAATVLGARHRVALHNASTGEIQLTSVPEIFDRARSSTWQVSVQL